MAKTFEDRIDELDIDRVDKKKKESMTPRSVAINVLSHLLSIEEPTWNMLTQTSKLTCPECGYSKRPKKTALS